MGKWTHNQLESLGSGGFGRVYRCERPDGTAFAKKVLEASDAGAKQRFAREVRILSELDHPNIIKVLAKRLRLEPYYYIMPLYQSSLHDVAHDLVGDVRRIHDIVARILDAIHYAHDQNVIHRDLKLENVLLNDDSDVVVSDFGLGLDLDSESLRQTQTGFGLGTPLYMAPEQLSDAKRADARCDVYAIGRIVYALYTGPISIGAQDTSGLPTGVARIVKRCTQRDPDDRYQSVAELKVEWDLMNQARTERDDLQTISDLTAKLLPGRRVTTKKVSRLLDALSRTDGDHDELRETLMSIDSKSITKMFEVDDDRSRMVIAEFVNVLTRQSWPFSYTDKIGARCAELFSATQDFDARAGLAFCASKVGASHNRWAVMEIAAQMLESLDDDGGALAAAERLRELSQTHLETLKPYVTIANVHPAVRGALER